MPVCAAVSPRHPGTRQPAVALLLCRGCWLQAGTRLFQTTHEKWLLGATGLAEAQANVKAETPSFSPIPSGIRKLLPWALTGHRLQLGGGPVPLGRCQSPPTLSYRLVWIGPIPLQSRAKFPLPLPLDAEAPPRGRRNSSCLILCGARRGARRDSAWKVELKGNRTLACRHGAQWVTGSLKFAHSAS